MSEIMDKPISGQGKNVENSPREQIIALLDQPNPYEYSPADIRPLQLSAAQQMFEDMRPRIKVLDKRAEDGRVDEIRTLDDIASLLLSHTTYKSYPQSFVTNRRWDRLSQWLSMVSTENFDDVDVVGAADIDDYLNRMWAAGYNISTSSGTTGKVSLLPKNERDIRLFRTYLRRFRGVWPNDIVGDQSWHFFGIGPGSGPTTAAFSMGFFCEDFGRPDLRRLLMNEPLSVAKVTRMAEMRIKIQSGAAQPDEIQQIENENRRQSEEYTAQFDALIARLMEVMHEPVFIQAMTPQMLDLVQRLRAKGVPDGAFHPRSIIGYGGGMKHFKLPDDWETQVKRFFGDVIYSKGYGMTEMNWLCPHCRAGHYHLPPTVIPLVLDESGETLMQPQDGLVHGRFGLLDLSTQIRWGGAISGDEVTIDIEGKCPCGRKGPNVRRVNRYADPSDDDKIQCAGTIDAYVRGAFVEN